MKGILEFSLPEEQEEFDSAARAGELRSALWEISQQVFRPARKHGYADSKIQELLDKADTLTLSSVDDDEQEVFVGTELVSLLEKKFYEILEEYNISL